MNQIIADIVKDMSKTQRMKMLRDVVALMHENGDSEQIARFLETYLGADALEIAQRYAGRVPGGNWVKRRGG
jgi:hypothetical protein